MNHLSISLCSLLLLAVAGYAEQATGDEPTPKKNPAAEKAAITSAEA